MLENGGKPKFHTGHKKKKSVSRKRELLSADVEITGLLAVAIWGGGLFRSRRGRFFKGVDRCRRARGEVLKKWN